MRRKIKEPKIVSSRYAVFWHECACCEYEFRFETYWKFIINDFRAMLSTSHSICKTCKPGISEASKFVREFTRERRTLTSGAKMPPVKRAKQTKGQGYQPAPPTTESIPRQPVMPPKPSSLHVEVSGYKVPKRPLGRATPKSTKIWMGNCYRPIHPDTQNPHED